MDEGMVAAADMARHAGIDPKVFRAALRRRAFGWHSHNDRWRVPRGSEQHREMEAVLAGLRRSAKG